MHTYLCYFRLQLSRTGKKTTDEIVVCYLQFFHGVLAAFNMSVLVILFLVILLPLLTTGFFF